MLIDHISLAVSNIERSARFYDAALRPLGISSRSESVRVRTYSRSGFDDFSIHQAERAITPSPQSHFAFGAHSSGAVDSFYEAALMNGGKDDGPPGLRPEYHPGYYAAFVIDPDGYRIEAVYHDRAQRGAHNPPPDEA